MSELVLRTSVIRPDQPGTTIAATDGVEAFSADDFARECKRVLTRFSY